MGKTLRIAAPAKINLHLHIKGRRPDGFHELVSLFLALDFGDTLELSLGDVPPPGPPLGPDPLSRCRVQFERAGETLGVEENSVLKAAALFRARTGLRRPLDLVLHKRIPLGGGLGGGSSDAAAALLGLNSLVERPLSPQELETLAAELGSDVPFFLGAAEGPAALVLGRGEEVRSLAVPLRFWVLLVNPGFPSPTARAFRLFDDAALPDTPPASPSVEALIARLGGPPREWPYRNDFLPPFLDRGSAGEAGAYRDILAALKGLGADFTGLSGAGSTCFGVFTGQEKAQEAALSLGKRYTFVQSTFPLVRSALVY